MRKITRWWDRAERGDLTFEVMARINPYFADGVCGVGICGMQNFYQRGDGYLYASRGYGNAETYLSFADVPSRYPELRHEKIRDIKVNERGEVTSFNW